MSSTGGVTTVRDLGGDGRVLAYYRRASILDELPAPEIFFSATIAGPSYFQIAREQNSIQGESAERAAWSQMVTDSADLDGVVLRAKGIGATGVKLYSDLEKELIERIVVAGRRHDLRVWSHIAVFPAKPSEIVREIGRASCREREERAAGADAARTKRGHESGGRREHRRR